MMTSRELLEIIEIDMDFCTRSYGTGACTAALGSSGVRKCFNTFKTCQDQDNFDKGVLTLRFAKNQHGLPKGVTIFPALQSVSTNPTQINIAGIDNKLGSLGRRERFTVQLSDFTYQDTLTDKYQAGRVDGSAQIDEGGYNPADRGTFFAKIKSRDPYYYGRPIRRKRGYVGDDLASMRTSHGIIDSISGPDVGGGVTVVARDILSIAENEKALCPKPSVGKLKTDIDDVADTFKLIPAGVGADYATGGCAVIGDEIVRFTRVGDTITLTRRGIYGSEKSDHSANDTFQQSYEVLATSMSQAIGDILRDFAGIPSGYINQSEWNAETLRWLPGLSVRTLIAKPTGVLTLLAELAQLGSSIWWDGEAKKIRYRLNRLVDATDTIATITDAANILEGSITTKDRADLRLSQFLLYHSPINFAKSATDPDNYKIVQVAVDLEAEGPQEYDQSQIRTIYSRWVADSSASAARTIASRALARYRDIPTDVSFDVDIKDIDSVGMASIVSMTTRVLQNEVGIAAPQGMQVTEFEETIPGHRARIVAQTFAFDGRYGFIRDTPSPVYSAATDDQKRLGTFYAADASGFADGTKPYQYY